MAHLLYDNSLFAAVRNEVDPAISKGSSGLESRLESCSLLGAVYNEVLRLNTASASVRTVSAPTHLGRLTLSPGATVLMPYRQLHLNKAVFGLDADAFDPSRFLGDRDLSRSPSFRPFGGGTTYCAGRHVAKREVLTFVALALHRYDFKLAGTQASKSQGSFPKVDEKKPCLGVLPPLVGNDVHVVITEREHS